MGFGRLYWDEMGWDAFRWIYKGGVLGLVWFGLVYRIGGFVVVVVILRF